jgi:hypothetical protein
VVAFLWSKSITHASTIVRKDLNGNLVMKNEEVTRKEIKKDLRVPTHRCRLNLCVDPLGMLDFRQEFGIRV